MPATETARRSGSRGRLRAGTLLPILAIVVAGVTAFEHLRLAGAEDLAPATPPTPQRGSVVWRTDFAAFPVGKTPPLDGQFQETPFNIYGGGSVTIVSDPVKGNIMRSFGAANQSRDETQRAEQVPPQRLAAGETVWVGFDLWVNPGLGVSDTSQGAFQLKVAPNEGSPTLGLSINGQRAEGLRIDSSEENHSLGPTPYGKWTRLLIGIHIAEDPESAWVEVWRDGRKTLPREPWDASNVSGDGASGGTTFPGGRYTYVKFGVYRGPQPFDADFRFANMTLFRKASES